MERGASELDERTAAAGDDVAAQLDLIVANIGDFTRLLHRLDERAPDEIRSDMSDAVELWDAQAEPAGEAVNDPMGALATTLLQSVMTAPSIEAVDRFASDRCGRVLFGALPSGGAVSTETEPCPDLPEELASAASYAVLVDGLDAADGLGITGSAALRTEVEDLDPEPSSALEALRRLRFVDQDPVALLAAVDRGTEAPAIERSPHPSCLAG